MDEQRLKDRLAFLGSLASGLAHEIKNPLSTMTITLGLLHEEFEAGETPRERRVLRKVELLEGEVARLEKIVQDFLQFAGGHAVRPRLVDVNEWIGELCDFFEPTCAAAGVKLERHLAPGLPQLLLDRDLMKQAVLNLLTNARQSMPDGGKISVRTWTTGDRVKIEVADTGQGIPADVLPRIFDPYFTTRDQGTGLGLPTVRRIVLEHGGQVDVDSRLGRGTRFTLTLAMPPSIAGAELRSLPGARIVSAEEAAAHFAPPAGTPPDGPDKAGAK
jgi:signal transduction histidine kinase